MFDYQKLQRIFNLIKKNFDNILKDAPVNQLYKIKNTNKWILVFSTILSARTNDKILIKVMLEFSKYIKDPKDVLEMDIQKLYTILKPLGFYKNKAKYLRMFCQKIINEYELKIPTKIEEIVKLPGVGYKVGAIILNDLFDIPIVGVDIHVHRILNRIGILKTKNELQTFRVINKIENDEIKKNLNKFLVSFGQTICKNKPLCYSCFLKKECNYFINSSKIEGGVFVSE